MNQIEAVWHVAAAWQRVSLVALAVAAVVQTLFVVKYAPRPWWRVAPGRAIMLKSSALLAALWLTLVNTFWVYPYENEISAAALCYIAATIVYQYVALIRSPRYPSKH